MTPDDVMAPNDVDFMAPYDVIALDDVTTSTCASAILDIQKLTDICNNVAFKPLFYLIKASGRNIVKRVVCLNYVCNSPLGILLSTV